MYDKLKTGVENIDSLLIRNEYKVRVYSEYFLGANRFIFSIHDLNLSQLRRMEELTHRYLKRWFGMPQSGSWAMVHDRHGMAVKSVTHFYKEARSLSLANVRLFGDVRVRHALDSKEALEAKWSRKFSSALDTRNLIHDLLATNPIPLNPLSPTSPATTPCPSTATSPSPTPSSPCPSTTTSIPPLPSLSCRFESGPGLLPRESFFQTRRRVSIRLSWRH